jgi:GNAT superfamily N-acetyltransferase
LVLTGYCRQFRQEDARACCEIVRLNLDADASISPELRRTLLLRESPQLMIDRASCFHVAVFEGGFGVEAVGAVEFNEIRFLAVAPPSQRKGVGRQLLQHLESMVPPTIFRNVFAYAAPAAVGFYLACGYQAGGGHILESYGERVPTVFVFKQLRE